MRVLERTIQQRRARVNCESLLAFDGVDQYADAGNNQNVMQAIDYDRDWTLGLLMVPQARATDPQNPYIFSTGRIDRALNLYMRTASNELNINFARTNAERIHARCAIRAQTSQYITIGYEHVNQEFQVRINGQSVAVTYVTKGVITASVHSSQNIFFGIPEVAAALNRAAKFLLSNLFVWNIKTSAQDDRRVHYLGGVVPSGIQAACVAHYATLKTGKSIPDLVASYNPAKVAAGLPTLTAYDAALVNFSDAEAGIPNQSTNTAYLDFYNKTPIIS